MEQIDLNAQLPGTAEGAQYEIDSIFANPEHPYHAKPGHPLRQQAIDRVTRLFEIKTAGRLNLVAQPVKVEVEAQQTSLDFEEQIEAVLCEGVLDG